MLDYLNGMHVRLALRTSRGQSLTEYALILGLVTLVVFVSLALLGPTIASYYNKASNSLPR